MAAGAYSVAHRLGLNVPNDLSIVGFDNLELIADALDPGLTTVHLPHYEMGAWALRHLVEMLRGSGAGHAIVAKRDLDGWPCRRCCSSPCSSRHR